MKLENKDNIKERILEVWKHMDWFVKVIIVLVVITLLMLLMAVIKHSPLAIFFSVFQFLVEIMALLIHKQVIKGESGKEKYIALLLCIIFMIITCMSCNVDTEKSDRNHFDKKEYHDENTEIMEAKTAVFPFADMDYKGMDILSVKEELKDAGFYNLSYEELEDLKYDEDEKIGCVETLSIDGITEIVNGQEYDVCSEIVISYHVLKKCNVNVHVNFVPNLIFDKYDVSYDFEGLGNGKIPHGEDVDINNIVEPGEYKLLFESDESSGVKGETTLVVEGDINVSYKIMCFSDEIRINVEYLEDIDKVKENEIMMPSKATEYKGQNYQDVESSLKELGFTNISTEILYDIYFGITGEGETESVSINGNKDFNRGDIFSNDSEVTITYHMNEEENPSNIEEETDSQDGVLYSSNDASTVKNGDSGVYSYVKHGREYDVYYIIDFDEGYVYWFTEGNGDDSCDKVKIECGTLNDNVIITYHDGDTVWSYGLHFKYVDHPSTLIMQDQNGFEYEYTTTILSDALELKSKKTVYEY